ncbi:hypothetical protein PHYSODRAFT_285530 [Phytophthora sojae]|uniref:RxLR effector protein n=2 Tax=Phytophthora sojae TaxID=67593 RepID=G4Z4P0_PHYSP|nr:hypothetical protein PHYSODRAFT_285530 [Phytophthora sojae]EGZ20884.1 hypothetical protein PHYSODRAFT_285530 [Phytophthora sojae]|eukprot:XP_009523601.1 hypothetical protein PHYSODRAFT_285530 [Phytophthora sojae]
MGSERHLRDQEMVADQDATNIEERAISDIARSVKEWARNTKALSDEDKVAKAMALLNKEASFKVLYKHKLTPDHVYTALKLQIRMRSAYGSGKWNSLLKSEDYLLWQDYYSFWNLAQRSKNV